MRPRYPVPACRVLPVPDKSPAVRAPLLLAVVLKAKGLEDEFLLFCRIHDIAFEGKPVETIIEL